MQLDKMPAITAFPSVAYQPCFNKVPPKSTVLFCFS